MTSEHEANQPYPYQPTNEPHTRRGQTVGCREPQQSYDPPAPPEAPNGGRSRPLGHQFTQAQRQRGKSHTGRNVTLITVGGLALLLIGVAVGHLDRSTTNNPGTPSSQSAGNTGQSAVSVHRKTSVLRHRAPTVPVATPARVGTTFTASDGNGNTYHVTLLKVIDPAHGANQYNNPPAGKRLVAAVFRLTGTGPSASDDANNNATLLGANQQVYEADFETISAYTNFNAGVFSVASRQTQIGAVVFEVPQRLKVTEVQWTTSSFNGTVSTWHLN
jgi:hypothetical protein